MMTDKLPSLSTQTVVSSHVLLPPLPGATPPQPPSLLKAETAEEEPYTIKCICDNTEDDGNTIYCETCDTWQHIECFYPNNVEDALRDEFSHSCAECKPRERELDRERAKERQRSRLAGTLLNAEALDKKPKRPPSKSHKKKPKPTDLQLNGNSPATLEPPNKHASPHEHPPPAKKAKNSHKPSHSVSSQAAKRSPSHGAPRPNNHGHPPSPANTPPDLPVDFDNHQYLNGLRQLFNRPEPQDSGTNQYVNLEVASTLSKWPRDPAMLREQTGHEFSDVFQKLPANMWQSRPSVQLCPKRLLCPPDGEFTWKYLATTIPVEKDIPLIELNGQIGYQKDYCEDPENRWSQLTCPLPFVFFHPVLPIYIDTRKEGGPSRYVRRSCKPNSILDTYLSAGQDSHFYLVSDRPIAAHEQITIPWDFRFPKPQKERMLRLLGLGDEEMTSTLEPDMDDADYQSIANWIHLVLTEYGGCACGLRSECAFARFLRDYHAKFQSRANQSSKKKSRKPKTHTLSPTSTGHATNSRAASEGHMDDAAENEANSVSGSSRSKPPSRDMTPARQGSFDTLGILTEPTDRDKRKVAMVEDSFRRMEQQYQPPRKKKRTSDGSTNPGSNKPKPASRNPASLNTALPNGTQDKHYVDAGTSRSKSASPASALSPGSINIPTHPASRQGSVPRAMALSPIADRPNYRNASIQTDPVQGEWYSGSCQKPKTRGRFVSLSKRLLENRHRQKLDEEGKQKRDSLVPEAAMPIAMELGPPTTEQSVPPGALTSPTMPKEAVNPPALVSPVLVNSGDTPMPDAPLSSPSTGKENGIGAAPDSPQSRSPDLRVQMPPVPTFGSAAAFSTPTTPLSAAGSMVQSPFSISNLPSPFGPPSVNGVAANPSPVKKKLSLSDYTKRNKAAARPTLGTSFLKPTAPSADDPKSATSATSVDNTGTMDSPTMERHEVQQTGAPGAAAISANGAVHNV